MDHPQFRQRLQSRPGSERSHHRCVVGWGQLRLYALMYATTSYPQDGDVTDNYVGQGRELQAGLEYTTGFGLSIRLGFRSEVYSGVADSSQADLYDLSGFRGGFLSVSYSF